MRELGPTTAACAAHAAVQQCLETPPAGRTQAAPPQRKILVFLREFSTSHLTRRAREAPYVILSPMLESVSVAA
jgi:hypothetical protein